MRGERPAAGGAGGGGGARRTHASRCIPWGSSFRCENGAGRAGGWARARSSRSGAPADATHVFCSTKMSLRGTVEDAMATPTLYCVSYESAASRRRPPALSQASTAVIV